MKKLIFGFLLIGGLVVAGTNNLPIETGQIIQRQHINKFHTALSGVVVPRNSSGNVTDVGADLGSSSFRWNDLFSKTLKLITTAGGNPITIQAPATVPTAYPITLPSATPTSEAIISMTTAGALNTNSAGVVKTANIADGAVTLVKTSAINKASSNAFNTTSSSAFTTNAATITTIGRPILIMFSSEASGTGYIRVFSSTGTAQANIVAERNGVAAFSTNTVGIQTNTGGNIEMFIPSGTLHYFDTPAAGTHTYAFRFFPDSGSSSSVQARGIVTVIEL